MTYDFGLVIITSVNKLHRDPSHDWLRVGHTDTTNMAQGTLGVGGWMIILPRGLFELYSTLEGSMNSHNHTRILSISS